MASARRKPRSLLKPGEKLVPGVRANEGIAAKYRAALEKLIRQMNESVLFWISAAYAEDPPLAVAMDAGGMPSRPFKMTPAMLGRLLDLAEGVPDALKKSTRARDRLIREGLIQRRPGTDDYALTPAGQKAIEDRARAERVTLNGLRRAADPFISVTRAGEELPSQVLTEAIAKLTARWQRQFDRAAPLLADYFAKATEERTDTQLQTILRDGGFSIRFQPSQAMQDVVSATTSANVALIKSIPQQYLGQVEGMVMRSVQAGRDLGTLTKDIEHQFGVTHRRAAFIARDQNNKATSAMIRARQLEHGLTEAIWRHSHGGKEPRPTHLANDGKRYNTVTGWYDPAVKRHIQPGEEPNCKCFSQTIIPGFFVAEAA